MAGLRGVKEKHSMAADREAVIRRVYYNLKTGFGSIARTHADAKKIDPGITRKHVSDFLVKQEHRQGAKRRGYNSFVPFAPREEYQLDLADFGVGSAEYRYAFVCIDVFTKMLAVVPLESKRPEDCVRALDIVLKKMGVPLQAYTDEGGEFKGAFEERLKHYFIDHTVTKAHAVFAERVIRTLREKIAARLAATRTSKAYWWVMLEDVVAQYNESPHSSTGEAPNDIHRLNMDEDKEWIEEIRGRMAGEGTLDAQVPGDSGG